MTPYQTETYKSLITISTEGFKFLALANGGASVALLAYLGNVVNRSGDVPDLTCSMAYFLTGLCLCGAAMAFSYLTQLDLYNATYGRRPQDGHKKWLWLAMGSFLLSLVFFAVGSMSAVVSFSGLKPQAPKETGKVEKAAEPMIAPAVTPKAELVPAKAASSSNPASASSGGVQKSR